MRQFLLLIFALASGFAAAAPKPRPMVPTGLPVDRAISLTLLIPDELLVLQEDQANIYYVPMPGNYMLSAGQSFAYGAALGVAASLVTEGVALAKRRNDAKRLATIEAALGEQPWGERLRQAVQQSLSPEQLGTGFDFVDEVRRERVGNKVFDAQGRALGTLEGHVGFSPNFRGLRIYLHGRIEDRRVIRDTQLRLQMERLPLRELGVEYLIALPDDAGLRQKHRVQRWAQQDPEAYSAALTAGIAEAVSLFNRHWHQEEHHFEGEKVRFRLDGGLQGKGRVVERGADRVLIASKHDILHSVPAELLERGMFD